MIGLLCFALAVLALPFKSKLRLEAENAVLRHQLIVLRRRLRGRVRLTNHDRWFFTQLYRWFPAILRGLTIIRPRDARALAQGRFSSMIRDRDCVYGAVVTRRLRAMGIRDKPIAPASPCWAYSTVGRNLVSLSAPQHTTCRQIHRSLPG
jgi:hypothetical protein